MLLFTFNWMNGSVLFTVYLRFRFVHFDSGSYFVSVHGQNLINQRMKVCECCVSIIEVDLSSSHLVLELRQLLSKQKSYLIDSFALFFKGKFLRDNHYLSEYGILCVRCNQYVGIKETSIIHMMKLKYRLSTYSGIESFKVDDGVLTVDSTDTSLQNEEVEELKYNFSFFESISDYVYRSFEELPKNSINFDEIKSRLTSDPSILRGVFTSPLIQDIMSDYNVVRHLLLLNPMIVHFIEVNPEFETYLQDDNNIAEIATLLSDPASYNDLKYTQQVLSKMVEKHIGRPFQLFNTVPL